MLILRSPAQLQLLEETLRKSLPTTLPVTGTPRIPLPPLPPLPCPAGDRLPGHPSVPPSLPPSLPLCWW